MRGPGAHPLRSRGRGPPPAGPVGWVPGVTSRPVVMSVDDDPSVSRAVARDLRRHLGDDYRVVRAESGPDALEALRELTVRGESTALLLADHRMPGMTGVEFLEQAMDLVPGGPARPAHRVRRHRRRHPRDQRRGPRPLPAQALGPAGGAPLPGARRAADRVACAGPAGVRGADAGRPPVVGADPGGQGVPRAQPGPLPPPGRAQRRRAAPPGRGAAAARRRRAARGVPARRCRPSPALGEGPGRAGGVVDHGRQPVLRRRGRRRRAGRSGCRRLRRERGPAHAARRAGGHRRPGGAVEPDRELPGLPARRLRRRSRATRPRAGGAVRGRDRHGHEVQRHPAAGGRARRPVRRRRRGDGPRRRPGHRGVVHAAAGTRRRRAGGARRLLRRGSARGGELPRSGGARRRGGQQRRAGGAALRARSPTAW